jgi:hypothetical protein
LPVQRELPTRGIVTASTLIGRNVMPFIVDCNSLA